MYFICNFLLVDLRQVFSCKKNWYRYKLIISEKGLKINFDLFLYNEKKIFFNQINFLAVML